jgi:hypothetical protein
MSKARPSRIKPETIEREAEVLRLRRGGLTFDLIAQQLNFAHASGAHKAYVNACKRIVYSEVEEVRAAETDRLDIAQAAIWNGVLQGQIPSIMALIKIMERRARLLGLDMPTKAQVEVTYYDTDTIDAEVRKLAALLDGLAQKELDSQPSETGADSE